MNALHKYEAKRYLMDKLAAKKKKDPKGHMRPGSAAMIGALLGPTGAAAGAELGRRGRATEGSPALRAFGGSIAGVPTGALAGALLGAGIAVTPRTLKLALLKAKKRFSKGIWNKFVARARLKDYKMSGEPRRTLAAGGALLGGGLGSIGGYFEGARRGAESVKYKGK
jgi:hypothetical protein